MVVLDFGISTSEGAEAPVAQETNTAPGETTINILNVGDITTTGYKFPSVIGTSGQVLTVPLTGNELEWDTPTGGGGGGDITNGGQTGTVTIGSTDTTLTLIGAAGINLNGGINIRYDNISSGVAQFVLTSINQFVDITNPSTTSILLPDASSASSGKKYIISKGYAGGALSIDTSVSDMIDGDNSLVLDVENQRVSLISSGVNRWMIV